METVPKMNDNGRYETIKENVGGSVTVFIAVCFLLQVKSYWLHRKM